MAKRKTKRPADWRKGADRAFSQGLAGALEGRRRHRTTVLMQRCLVALVGGDTWMWALFEPPVAGIMIGDFLLANAVAAGPPRPAPRFLVAREQAAG